MIIKKLLNSIDIDDVHSQKPTVIYDKISKMYCWKNMKWSDYKDLLNELDGDIYRLYNQDYFRLTTHERVEIGALADILHLILSEIISRDNKVKYLIDEFKHPLSKEIVRSYAKRTKML